MRTKLASSGRGLDAERRLVLAAVDRLAGQWRDLALKIHAHPELGYAERRASRWLCTALAKAGFAVKRGVAGMPTAFCAARAPEAKGPVLAYLAEYDALPETGHSCGHNLSGVASCLAAHALAAALGKKVSGQVRVYGTPAEEGGDGGKLHLLAHGFMDDVDFAMMSHAGFMNLSWRDMVGQRKVVLAFRPDQSMDRRDPAAQREAANRQVEAVGRMLQACARLRRGLRSRSRIEAAVIEAGRIVKPKARFHLECQRARMEILITATQAGYIRRLERRLGGTARAIAKAAGLAITLDGQWGTYQPMRRVAALERCYAESLQQLGEPHGRFPAAWSIGSTDCGNVSQVLPTLHTYFKAAEPGIEHHTREFTRAAAAPLALAGMVATAKAMALSGLRLLRDPKLRQRIKRDFQRAEKA